jgi:hypothetical protein
MAGFGKHRIKFLALAGAALLMLFTMSPGAAQEDAPPQPARPAVYPADVLDAPPLPKLGKGEWASKKTVFDDALALQDADGNDLDKLFDLSGTTWSAHVDVPKGAPPSEAEAEDDPVSQLIEPFLDALAKKYYDYRVQLPGTSDYLMAAADDGEAADISGMSVVAQGQLRFIAVTERSDGNVEIFISDEVPVADLLQKISGKKEAPAPKP